MGQLFGLLPKYSERMNGRQKAKLSPTYKVFSTRTSLVMVGVSIESQSHFDPHAQDPGADLQAALTASIFFWLSGFCRSDLDFVAFARGVKEDGEQSQTLTVRPQEVIHPSTPGRILLPDPAVVSGRGGLLDVALSVRAFETFDVGGLGVSTPLRSCFFARMRGKRRRKDKKRRTDLMIPNIPFAQCCPTVQ